MNKHIQRAIYNIVEKNLDAMRNNFNKVLSEKAMNKIDERKKDVANTYFDQKRK